MTPKTNIQETRRTDDLQALARLFEVQPDDAFEAFNALDFEQQFDLIQKFQGDLSPDCYTFVARLIADTNRIEDADIRDEIYALGEEYAGQRIGALQRLKENLRATAAQLEDQAQAITVVELQSAVDIDQQLEAGRKRLAELRRQRSEIEPELFELQDTDAQIARIQAELDRLRESDLAQKKRELVELTATLDQRTAERERLDADIAELTPQVNAANRNLQAKRSVLNVLRKQREERQQEQVRSAVIIDRVQNLVAQLGSPEYALTLDHLQGWSSLTNGNATVLIADLSDINTLPAELVGVHRSGVEIINVGLPNAEEIEELFITARNDETRINEAQWVDLVHRLNECDCTQILDYFKKCRHRNIELNMRTLRELTSRTEDLWPQLLAEDNLQSLQTKLRERILGQDFAIQKVIDTLRRVRHHIEDMVNSGKFEETPLAYFFFAGPTGVGKTEVFRVLCEELKGIASRKINMTEYSQEHAVMRLLGAPPSYRGDPKGELGQFLIDNPACILLFDEFEKSHQKTWLNFLTMLEGGFTTGDGTKIDLSQSILFFTSNAGSAELERIENDMSEGQQENIRQRNSEIVRNALRASGAPPELIGRLLEAITPFNHLTREVATQIIRLNLKRIRDRLDSSGHAVEFHPSVTDYLLAFYERERASGARAIANHITGTFYSEILARLRS